MTAKKKKSASEKAIEKKQVKVSPVESKSIESGNDSSKYYQLSAKAATGYSPLGYKTGMHVLNGYKGKAIVGFPYAPLISEDEVQKIAIDFGFNKKLFKEMALWVNVDFEKCLSFYHANFLDGFSQVQSMRLNLAKERIMLGLKKLMMLYERHFVSSSVYDFYQVISVDELTSARTKLTSDIYIAAMIVYNKLLTNDLYQEKSLKEKKPTTTFSLQDHLVMMMKDGLIDFNNMPRQGLKFFSLTIAKVINRTPGNIRTFLTALMQEHSGIKRESMSKTSQDAMRKIDLARKKLID